ncbi:MAG: MFS transporter [Fidelibacterota bacterium]
MASASQKNITFLWAAQGITATGDAMYQIALVWLILDLTGSSVVTGLVAMSAYLPALLFGLWAGVFSDRYPRMTVMMISQVSQALTVTVIPVLIWYGWSHALLIGGLAFLRASFGTLFPPALNAFVPQIVTGKRLVKANSVLSTSSQLAYLIGPALAGSLLKFISLTWLFVFDGVSFLAALGFLLLIRVRRDQSPDHREVAPSVREIRQGFAYLETHPTVGFMLLLTVINNLFIMGPAIVGMPILVKQALHGTATDYAFVEALMALGMLIGSGAVYRYLHSVRSGRLLLIGMILDGLTYALFFLAQSVTFVMIMIVIHGVGIPLIVISRTAIIQKHVKNTYHGRLFSMVHLSVVGVTALSSALTGIVAGFTDIRFVFLGIGLGAAACGLAGAFIPGLKELD